MRMHNANQAHDEYVEKEMNKASERLQRHRRNLDADHRDIGKLQQEMNAVMDQGVELVGKVESMVDKLCHCGDTWGSPVLKGEGTSATPFEFDEGLEYAESPPLTVAASSTEYLSVPVAEESHGHVHDGCLPTPPPGSTSDAENIPPR